MTSMAGQGKRRQAVDVGSLIGLDVEVRGAGQCIRGVLRSVGPDFVGVERASGRMAFVAREAVAVIADECPAGLHEERRRGGSPASEGGEQ